MDRDRAYATALLIVGVSALVIGWSSIRSGSPSVASVLMAVGGLGLALTSGYQLLARKKAAPGNAGLFWIVILGAVLVLFGAFLQLLAILGTGR